MKCIQSTDGGLKRGCGRQLSRPALVCVVALCLGALAGCGVTVERPKVGYYFSNPLLNEQWKPVAFQFSDSDSEKEQRARLDRVRVVQTPQREKKRTRIARKSTAKKVAKSSKPPRKQASKKELAQPLRGPELDVVRNEMVLSARRLLGIKDSFTQDSFLRHILVVNNLGLGSLPRDGIVPWLSKKQGTEKTPTAVKPGDVLFLGDKSPELAVIVETVDDGGLVTYIGYWNEEVQRGVLSLTHPEVRREESSQTVLNTFIKKGRLAGGLLVGGFHLHSAYGSAVAQGGR